jgi:hypothetical protein
VRESVLVPVPFVGGVPVPLVGIVHVVLVRDRHMPASLAVLVLMPIVGAVPLRGALVDVVLMVSVQVPVMHVVDMIQMRDGGVSAAVPVRVVVTGMRAVVGSGRHRGSPFMTEQRRVHRTSRARWPGGRSGLHQSASQAHKKAGYPLSGNCRSRHHARSDFPAQRACIELSPVARPEPHPDTLPYYGKTASRTTAGR